MIDTDKYEGHTKGPWICDVCYENGIIVAGKEGEEQRVTIVQSKYLDPTPTDDYDDISFEEAVSNINLIADAPLLLEEVKRLREDNHVLRMIDWEYERVWEWLMENADHTCRKLLLLIEEWKEGDEE
jgi:hypothetical protein|tara:strand:- start:233 stop:613 length:381 start_codon:yes stop_codon:yes gene_type:complete